MDSSEIEMICDLNEVAAKQVEKIFGFKVVIDKTLPEGAVTLKCGDVYMTTMFFKKGDHHEQ